MGKVEGKEAYSVDVPLQLYFRTEEPVQIRHIAASLMALERLAKQFPDMLEQLSSVDIHGYELRVTHLESGSLLQDLILKVFFDSPEKQQKFNEFLENHPMGTAVRWGLGGLLTILLINQLMLVYQNFAGNDSPSIQANNNTIISIGADSLGVTPSELEKLVSDAISGNRKKLFKASLDVLRPIEGHGEASLEIPSMAGQGITIPAPAMAEVPFDADLNAQEQNLSYENALLEIRALDRDKTESGWWGILPSVVGEKRLRLHFDEGVDVDAIAYRPEVQVDAVVTYRNDLNQAKLVPKHITITRIYPAERR